MIVQNMCRLWTFFVSASLVAVSGGLAQTTGTHPVANPVVAATFRPPANALDWNRYVNLEDCQHLVVRMIDSVFRNRRADTLRYQTTDTLPSVAVQTAQQCLARFPIDAVEPFQLPVLLNLAIQGNDDATVQAVVAAQLARTKPDSIRAKAEVLRVTIEQLVSASPARRQLALTFADQADRLGDDALLERSAIRKTLRKFAILAADLDSLITQTTLILDYLRRVPSRVTSQWEQEGIAKYEIPVTETYLHWLRYLQNHTENDFARYVEGMRMTKASLIGEQAPAVAADFWFNTETTGPLAVAVPGRVSLVVFVDQSSTDISDHYSYAVLKRLQQRFPDLRVILTGATRGYFRDLPVPLPPDQEARLIHQYFTDSLGLPGVLGISTRTFYKHSNGVLLPQDIANESNYTMAIGVNQNATFLVDDRGRIVFQAQTEIYGRADIDGAGMENMLAATIDNFLKHAASDRSSPIPSTSSVGTGPSH